MNPALATRRAHPVFGHVTRLRCCPCVEKSIYSDKHGQLADLLRRRRVEVGLTQKQVAGRLGRHHPFVHDYETGQRRLDVVRLTQVTGILGTTLTAVTTELFGTAVDAGAVPAADTATTPPPSPPGDYHNQWTRLAALLRSRRTTAGLTETEVARRLHTPQSFVSKYETMNRRLDLIELDHVATALDTTVFDLVATFEREIRSTE